MKLLVAISPPSQTQTDDAPTLDTRASKERLVLPHERVLRLSEDAQKVGFAESFKRRHDRQPTDESTRGDQMHMQVRQNGERTRG